jgi:hypothetical protein
MKMARTECWVNVSAVPQELCGARMRWVFSGEAVTQESLGHSPRNSAPRKRIALKARFNLAGETP